MVHAYVIAALALLSAGACNGERRLLTSGTESEPAASARAGAEQPDPAGDPAPDPDPAGFASEAVARAILAERFRAAGFRIRHDVAVTRPDAFALTVDGYDPRARVGFEYVAESERDTDLDAAERAALARDPDDRILVIDAAPVDAIERQAAAFLRAHAPTAADPG